MHPSASLPASILSRRAPAHRYCAALLLALGAATAPGADVNWNGSQALSGTGGDDIHLLGSTVVTLSGAASIVEEFLYHESNSTGPTLLTINSADATLRTLVANVTSLAKLDGQSLVISGTANFRPGLLSDNGHTFVSLVKDGGTGELILDRAAATDDALSGAQVRVVSGTLSIEGSAAGSPIFGLGGALQLDGAAGKLRLGSTGVAGTVFANNLLANESGILEHSAVSVDTLAGSLTIGTGKTLTAQMTAGSLTVSGVLSGGGLIKTGGGGLVFSNTSTPSTLSVSGGRLEFSGLAQLNFVPTIAAGATLALTSGAGTNALPAVFTVPTGTLELVPGGLGAATNSVTLSGGTLKLAAAAALTNAVTASGSSGIEVGPAASTLAKLTILPGATLTKSAGQLTTTNLTLNGAGTYTLGVTGSDWKIPAITSSGAVNFIKTGAGTLEISSAITGGGTVTNAGPGTLNLNGTAGYAVLNANAGVTNVNTALTGRTVTVNAGGAVNFTNNQTLAALNIAAGGVVTLRATTGFAALPESAAVPEAGTLGWLLLGTLGVLARRRR